MGRTIRVDLATEKNQDGRGGRAGEPDRTEGDWRRRNPAADSEWCCFVFSFAIINV